MSFIGQVGRIHHVGLHKFNFKGCSIICIRKNCQPIICKKYFSTNLSNFANSSSNGSSEVEEKSKHSSLISESPQNSIKNSSDDSPPGKDLLTHPDNNLNKGVDKLKPRITDIIDKQIHDLDITPVNYRRDTYDNPLQRTGTILKDDLVQFFSRNVRRVLPFIKDTDREQNNSIVDSKNQSVGFLPDMKEIWPSTCDILIVGGGVMGTSIAYHLKEKTFRGLDVIVVEKDYSYSQSSTTRSVGGIRQQFSIPENIQLSQYGMEFLRNAAELLTVEGRDPVCVDFHPNGYLTLASDEGFEQLKENYMMQREVGAKVQFLSPAKIKSQYPWMNTDGIAAGVLGIENEGWFDPWGFLLGLRHKATDIGATFVHAEFKGAEFKDQSDLILEGVPTLTKRRLDSAIVELPNGEVKKIKFAIMVIAAGAWSGEIGRRLGLGNPNKTGIMGMAIPIEPRKRFVYCIHSPDGPGLNSPLLIDPNGTYFRREGLGDMYLCGQSPLDEPSTIDLEVDEDFFMENVWPTIAHRVPSFENLKLMSSWAGYYDYNTFDQNGIVGEHPNFANVLLACGFSGHGLQQGAGIGRAITELIVYGEYKTVDLCRLAYDRVLMNKPLYESGIV